MWQSFNVVIAIGIPIIYSAGALLNTIVKRSRIIQGVLFPIFAKMGVGMFLTRLHSHCSRLDVSYWDTWITNLLEASNIPIFALFSTGLLTWLMTPWFNNVIQASEIGTGFDNSCPREGRSQATGLSLRWPFTRFRFALLRVSETFMCQWWWCPAKYRAQSAHANQVETFPLILLAAWASAESVKVSLESRAVSLTWIMLMRYLHTFAYYRDLSRLRTLSWLSVV